MRAGSVYFVAWLDTAQAKDFAATIPEEKLGA
jgi:hypothetical protein